MTRYSSPCGNGDVWYVDIEALTIGKMDPRTVTWTDYPVAERYRGHGLIQTKDGDIWVAGHNGFIRVDSNSGQIKFYDYNPNSPRPPHGNTPFADSKENVWTTNMWTNQIAMIDPKTGEISRFDGPSPYGAAYGMVIDKQDNLWIAEWLNCKIEKFDTETKKFTEYAPPTKPCNARRVFVDHAGMVWIPMDWPGKIAMLDPKTGNFTEYNEPVPWAFPYDIQEDSANNLWIADSGQGGGLYKFEPKIKKFTYYPAEQRTDMPKIKMSDEDSIWYTTRGGSTKTMSLGVLYPDKTQIKDAGGLSEVRCSTVIDVGKKGSREAPLFCVRTSFVRTSLRNVPKSFPSPQSFKIAFRHTPRSLYPQMRCTDPLG